MLLNDYVGLVLIIHRNDPFHTLTQSQLYP